MLDVALTDVVEVGAEPRSGNPFDGGLRTRLRVVLADGQRHLFVVSGLKGVIAALSEAVDAARRGYRAGHPPGRVSLARTTSWTISSTSVSVTWTAPSVPVTETTTG